MPDVRCRSQDGPVTDRVETVLLLRRALEHSRAGCPCLSPRGNAADEFPELAAHAQELERAACDKAVRFALVYLALGWESLLEVEVRRIVHHGGGCKKLVQTFKRPGVLGGFVHCGDVVLPGTQHCLKHGGAP